MEAYAARSTRLKRWALVAAGWALYGLFFASQAVVVRAYEGWPLRLWGTVASWLVCALVWLVLTPGLLYMARRFPLERGRWLRSALVHMAAAAACALVQLSAYVLLASFLGLSPPGQPFMVFLRNIFVGSFHFDLLTYWAVVGLFHVLDYYRKYRERELRASQLETRLAQARLDALMMQLHPHFLFNTLNSISVLMAEDVKAARRMLARLGDLLRASLESEGAHEVSLREELMFLQSYLEIEQTRFHDRLTVRMDVDPAALDARVPNLILQPLVENAIRHGVAPRASAGLVEVRARRSNGTVRLEVRDDGPGLAEAPAESMAKGIGLRNTRARLEQLYGTRHRFEISQGEPAGLTVAIEIPYGGQPART